MDAGEVMIITQEFYGTTVKPKISIYCKLNEIQVNSAIKTMIDCFSFEPFQL